MNTFDGCCGSCIHMNTNDYVRTKDHCYCTRRRQYYDLKERKCAYYEYDRYKDYYDLNHRWHIVSAVLRILPELAGEPWAERLRAFRTDVLEKDARYEQALRVYDVAGPFLACRLTADPRAEDLCRTLARCWLKPVSDKIAKGEYDGAFRLYAGMVDVLLNLYPEQLAAYCRAKRVPAAALRMGGG